MREPINAQMKCGLTAAALFQAIQSPVRIVGNNDVGTGTQDAADVFLAVDGPGVNGNSGLVRQSAFIRNIDDLAEMRMNGLNAKGGCNG